MAASLPWYGAATHPPTDSTQVQSLERSSQVNKKEGSRVEAIMALP